MSDSLGFLSLQSQFEFACDWHLIGAKKSTQTFFVQSFSTTLRVMDVRVENRGRPHQKVRFPAPPVVGRNFLTPGHPGVRVRNVRGKSGPKSLCLCCFFAFLSYSCTWKIAKYSADLPSYCKPFGDLQSCFYCREGGGQKGTEVGFRNCFPWGGGSPHAV